MKALHILCALIATLIFSGAASASVTYRTMVGPITGKTITFAVYEPPGFDPAVSHPLLLWLHGKMADEHSGANTVVPYLTADINADKIYAPVAVFPRGGSDSWYTDNCSGSWPIETMLIQELLPEIESEYLLDAHVIEGFSMGDYGAEKLFAKYPGMFDYVEGYAGPKTDPAIATWNEDPSGFADVFCSNFTTYTNDAPLTWFTTNQSALASLGIRLGVSATNADGTRFTVLDMNTKLNQLGLMHTLVSVTVTGHILNDYYKNDATRFYALRK